MNNHANLLVGELTEQEALELFYVLRSQGVESVHCDTGLVMQSVLDSFVVSFHLGEVLSTASRVKYNGVEGWAMCQGSNHHRAFIAATVDCTSRRSDSDIKQILDPQLELLLQRRIDRITTENNCVKSTKVNFGLMVEG